MGLLKKVCITFAAGTVIAISAGYYGNKYAILGLDEGDYTKNTEVTVPYKPCINENTVIEFVYNYSDGYIDTQYTLPAKYMQGYDREQLQNAYDSWQMDSFSANKVVFSKNFQEESPQHYILKEYNGYIGVFYKKSGILKEITSTPVASLSDADKKRYAEGVEIDGEDNLVKFIENLET